ncbi:MAG: hypothetical protein WCO98_16800, partial [bacterium]
LMLFIMGIIISFCVNAVTFHPLVSKTSRDIGVLNCPRAIVNNETTRQIAVVDFDQDNGSRVIFFNYDAKQLRDINLALSPDNFPTDPLIANPQLAVAGENSYILCKRKDANGIAIEVTCLDEAGDDRPDIMLPEGTENGAATLLPDKHAIIAFIRVKNKTAEFALTIEDSEGDFTSLTTLNNLFDGQYTKLVITGISINKAGQVLVGVAQAGDNPYSFVRSWLLQLTIINRKITKDITVINKQSLFDSKNMPTERARLLALTAGKNGYPPQVSVPLFTSISQTSDGNIITGGCNKDPFVRIYNTADKSVLAYPASNAGGQATAIINGADNKKIITVNGANSGAVREFTMDMKQVRTWNIPPAYNLYNPVSIASDENNVYIVTSCSGDYCLHQFDNNGKWRWSRQIKAPKTLTNAVPIIACTSADIVYVGWQIIGCAGVSYVDCWFADGSPGPALWRDAVVVKSKPTGGIPLFTGANGRLYITRDTDKGSRVYTYSPSGSLMQTLPPEVTGVSVVTINGTMGLINKDKDGVLITKFSPQGKSMGWKRVVRTSINSKVIPFCGHNCYLWKSDEDKIDEYDDNLDFVNSTEVKFTGFENTSVNPYAITATRNDKIYYATKNAVLVSVE